jgi:magnesium transporter
VERKLSEHEEIEVLLESFSKQVEEIVNEAETIEGNVQSTQEIVELILDSNRNSLLALDLKISIATMGLGTGTLIAGLFGMNLTSHLEDSAHAFYVMSGVSCVIALAAAWAGFRILARMRKIGLSSNRSARRPSGWKGLPLPLRQRGSGGWS